MANNFLRLAVASVALVAQKGSKVLTWMDRQAAQAADKVEAEVASGRVAAQEEPKPVSDPDAGKGSS